MSFVFFLRFLAAFFPTQGSFRVWSVQAGTGVTWGFKRKGTWALGLGIWRLGDVSVTMHGRPRPDGWGGFYKVCFDGWMGFERRYI